MKKLATQYENAFKRAKQTGFLSLANNNLKDFPKEINDFDNLNFQDDKWWESNPLTKIDLSNNEISSIPIDINNQNDLILIRMLNNKLDSLPESVFMLRNIKSLDFSLNKINKLPPNIGSCSSLVELLLQNNLIKEIPFNLSGLQSLEVLNLSSNQLDLCPNFNKLRKLKKLDLSQNSIKSIEKSSFDGLINLDQLILGKNQIKYLDESSFSSLQNLTILDLRENKLNNFNVALNTPKLDSLILAFNSITSLSFLSKSEELLKLNVFDIKNNKIETLDPSILTLKNLQTLDISNNDLTDIPSELGLMQKLVRINIIGNSLKCIKSSVRSAGAEILKKYLVSRIPEEELQNINISEKNKNSNNMVSSNKAQMDEWDYMIREFLSNNRELAIKDKKIRDINEKIWGLIDLTLLDLSNNELSEIKRDIRRLNGLKILRMSNNRITNVEEGILELINLQELELKKNRLESLFDNIHNSAFKWNKMVILDLSMNNFRRVPAFISTLQTLRILQMNFNQIESIDLLFNGELKSLEVMNFSNNKIDNVSEKIFELQTLQFINLENNNLSKIPTIIGFMSITNIQIDGNPIKQIRRNILEKGAVEILNFLRDRHSGEIPNISNNVKKHEPVSKNQEIKIFKEKQEMEIENEAFTVGRMNKQINQNLKPNLDEDRRTFDLDARNKHLKENKNVAVSNEIKLKEIEEQIKVLEIDLKENYAMNQFQKTSKRKELQQLIVAKSKLIKEINEK